MNREFVPVQYIPKLSSFCLRFFGRIADSDSVHEESALEAIRQNAHGLKSELSVVNNKTHIFIMTKVHAYLLTYSFSHMIF